MAYDLDKWFANGRKPVKRTRWLPPFLALMMVASALIAVLEVFDNGKDTDRYPDLVIFWLPILVATLSSPFARDAWIGPRATKMFDEFERDALARATARAYAILMLLLIPLFGWLWLANVNGWPAPRNALDWSSLGLAVLFIGAILPIFFAEIMVPFPPAEDSSKE